MGRGITKPVGAHEPAPVLLSELIHQHVRVAIETTVHEELRAALGATPNERSEVQRGYRNGISERPLTGPTGPATLTLPRATVFGVAGAKEWTSGIVPRYQRRRREVNEAVVATYLAAATPAQFAARSNPCSRPRPSRRARCRVWWPR